MKQIIRGKKYSTETAKQVGVACNAGGWNDFTHYEERLYLKKNGEYFLHGEGGRETRYAQSSGQNSWSGGEKIIPLTYEAAKAWALANLDAGEVEALFGDVVEDGRKVVLNTTLSAAANDKLRRMASMRGESLKTVLERLIMEA